MPGYPNRSFDAGPTAKRMDRSLHFLAQRLKRLKVAQTEGQQARTALEAYFLNLEERQERAVRRREWFDWLVSKLSK